MKTKIVIISIILLLVMVFACGCVPFMGKIGMVNPVNEEPLSTEKVGPSDGLIKVLIGFKEKPGPAEQALVKSAGGKIKYTYHIVDAIAASIPEKAIAALQKNFSIRYVEADGIVEAIDELDNSWGVKRIGAGVVHNNVNKGTGIKVAVIDTGIDYTHPDLDANYYGGWDFVNDDSEPMDDHGHGTHVAGIIAAEDNGFGVVGVAPEANLYALKALNENGSGYVSDVVSAIQWAAEHGIQVINMSLGGGASSTFQEACSSAYYEDGILLVSSAGNRGNYSGTGDNITNPAGYDSVIAVAATNQSDQRASWSSTGSELELAAPGVGIYSTYKGGGYTTKSGTSMASPHVAGTAALVWATDSFLSNDDVRYQLQNTADDLGALGEDSEYGYGLVDAVKAVSAEIPSPAIGTIEGKVTDANKPDLNIAGVKVVIEGTNLSMTTDAYGDYTINGIDVGFCTITVSATGYIEESQTAEVLQDQTIIVDFALTPIPTPTPSNTMHVNDITISPEIVNHGKNIFAKAIATVAIVDEDIAPVEGVTVSGHWSNATKDRDSGITDGSGKVSLKSNKVKNPKNETTFTFTVDKVKKDGWTYDSDANTKTSENISL